jgi:hypothetical protein
MTTQRVEQLFGAAWEDVLASGAPAMSVGTIQRVEYRPFVDRIFSGDSAFIRDMVRSIYAGDVYVFLNVYQPPMLKALKDASYRWASQQPTQEPKLVDGVPDYRSRRDWHAEEKGGYSSTYDMMHFYRWNGDPLGVFNLFADQYRLLRVISGFAPDAVAGNLPSDGIVDRIEISHYPRGIGGIAFHSDPLMAQRFQLTLTLTEFGKDFKKGGFAVGSQDGQIVRVEPLAPIGSMFGFMPSVCHGVEVIDPDLPVDWEGPTGRWYASTSMVTSAAVAKREVTKPVAGYPTLREQIHRFQKQGVQAR